MTTPKCCDEESVYVDNVPGKEYFYCRNCKKEVFTQAKEQLGDVLPFWTSPPESVLYIDIWPNTTKGNYDDDQD